MRKIWTSFFMSALFVNVFSQVGPITQICLVTVDTNSTHNIITWEKTEQFSIYPIDSINIYRATPDGNDSLIAQLPWADSSEYHDYSVDPNLSYHRYRISGIDNLGVEGPLSVPHQTIHFNVWDNGSGNLHLVWTPYIGDSVDRYVCWSDSSGSQPGWQWVNSTLDDQDTAWWDNATPSDWTNLAYLVDVEWNKQCAVTKAQGHNSTRSNRAGITQGSNGVSDYRSVEAFTVYPNPADELIRVVYSSTDWNEKSMEIVDMTGKIVLSKQAVKMIGLWQGSVDISNLNAGVYQVIIRSAGENFTRTFVKK